MTYKIAGKSHMQIHKKLKYWMYQEEIRKRINITSKYRGMTLPFPELLEKMEGDANEQSRLLSDKDRELFQNILANTISKKIRGKIQAS